MDTAKFGEFCRICVEQIEHLPPNPQGSQQGVEGSNGLKGIASLWPAKVPPGAFKMYKIKQKPEDFLVREISIIKPGEKGKYTYFLLKKKNYNTIRALEHVANALHLNPKRLGFAGNKDKLAITEQTCSIPEIEREKLEKIKLRDIELKFLGKGNEPISLGDLEGNEFEIIVRNIDKKPKPKTEFVNYFGKQRFGKANVPVGKAIVQNRHSNARRV